MTGYESKKAAAQDKLADIILWKRRPKVDNKALANAINIWNQPVYQPPKDEYVRPGALDFKKVKSK